MDLGTCSLDNELVFFGLDDRLLEGELHMAYALVLRVLLHYSHFTIEFDAIAVLFQAIIRWLWPYPFGLVADFVEEVSSVDGEG